MWVQALCHRSGLVKISAGLSLVEMCLKQTIPLMMPLWTLWCEKGIPALIQSRMGKGRTHYNGFIVPKHPGITDNDAQLTFKAPC